MMQEWRRSGSSMIWSDRTKRRLRSYRNSSGRETLRLRQWGGNSVRSMTVKQYAWKKWRGKLNTSRIYSNSIDINKFSLNVLLLFKHHVITGIHAILWRCNPAQLHLVLWHRCYLYIIRHFCSDSSYFLTPLNQLAFCLLSPINRVFKSDIFCTVQQNWSGDICSWLTFEL